MGNLVVADSLYAHLGLNPAKHLSICLTLKYEEFSAARTIYVLKCFAG